MKKLHFKIERGTHGGVANAAYLGDDDEVVAELATAVIEAINLDVQITIGEVTMPAAMWASPDHWAEDWAEKLGVPYDDAVEAVASLMASAIAEDDPPPPSAGSTGDSASPGSGTPQDAPTAPQTGTYTIDRSQDEDSADRWFIADERGNWIGEPFATRELAADAIANDEIPSNYCTACSHFHDPGEPCRCPECGQAAAKPGGTCDTPHT